MASIQTLPRPLRGPVRFLRVLVNWPLSALDELGEQLSFYGKAMGWLWKAVIRYYKEVLRLVARGLCGRRLNEPP
mgnify:CR=1 FL=1